MPRNIHLLKCMVIMTHVYPCPVIVTKYTMLRVGGLPHKLLKSNPKPNILTDLSNFSLALVERGHGESRRTFTSSTMITRRYDAIRRCDTTAVQYDTAQFDTADHSTSLVRHTVLLAHPAIAVTTSEHLRMRIGSNLHLLFWMPPTKRLCWLP